MKFFVPLLFLFNAFFVHKTFSCRQTVDNKYGCCGSFYGKVDCLPPLPDSDCNFFGNNCAVCNYIFDAKCESFEPQCSCYYCCEPKYFESCWNGCKNCIKDGEGGCPENKQATNAIFKSTNGGGNSSFAHLETVKKAQQHFDTVDADKSGTISLTEAIEYLAKTKNGTSADHLAKDTKWFIKMDNNGNSEIEPAEFDRALI